MVPGSQKPLLSQQPGQLAGPHVGPLQAPALQESPVGQAPHAAPPVPHCVVLVPGSHVSPAQQPPQLDALQTGFSQVPA